VTQCRQQLQPAPTLIVVSSDSDMQQLLAQDCYWLELLQVRRAQQTLQEREREQ
jgi:5'-3' exonuclease